MITNAILAIFLSFIHVILYPITSLSDVTLPVTLTNNLLIVNNYLKNVDNFFPLYTLFAIITLYVSIEVFILLYKLIKWGYSKIPGIN